MLEWLKSYLENRKQCVNVNGNSSKFIDITCVLGPLLLLIYINDIYIYIYIYILSTQKVSFHLFADDTCLFHSNKNLKTLETNVNVALKNFSNWVKANKLILNVNTHTYSYSTLAKIMIVIKCKLSSLLAKEN